jgi:hypothetical protein
MKILYLHGLGAKPGGFKPTFLSQQGFELINPALGDEDFPASVAIAQQAFDAQPVEVVVGSSRGGAVAMQLRLGNTPLVLIAPAWRRCGSANQVGPRTIILHSPHDDLIPAADSQALAQQSNLPADQLLLLGQGHTMTDPESLAALVTAIRRAATL